MTYSRRRMSAGRKSRVPLGGLVEDTISALRAHVVQAVTHVSVGEILNPGDLPVFEAPFDPAGAAHHERSGRYLSAFRQQRAGGDNRAAPDANAVQENRPHSYQTAGLDDAAMNDRAMADGHVVADDGRVGVAHDVYDGAVLYIRPPPYTDPMDVGADHDQHPHTAVFANFN